MMSGEVTVCDHLQASAASRVTWVPLVTRVLRVTREPPVKRVSRVRRHSYHHMNQVLVLCLGDVIDTSDGW